MASGHNRERLYNNIDSFRTVQEPKTGPLEHFENCRIAHISVAFSVVCKEDLGRKRRTPLPPRLCNCAKSGGSEG
jgi:hypothetical protein